MNNVGKDRVHGRLLQLSAVLTLLGLVAGCVNINPPAVPQKASWAIEIRGSSWQVGEPADLEIYTNPPRPGEVISLTLLAPGPGQPQLQNKQSGFFGLSGVQLPWLLPQYQEMEMALAAAAGASYIGLDFDWRRIQPEPDRFDWTGTDEVVALAKKHGLRLAPMLLYTPLWASPAPYAPLDYHRAPPADFNHYRDFVYTVVERYKPNGLSPLTSDGYGITDWVMWNEPNMRFHGDEDVPGEFWLGSLQDYIHLLKAGYEGAHAADPGSNVLNGGLADVFWVDGKADLLTSLERLYDPDGDGDTADGARPYFDTLNIHTYQPGPPDADWYNQRLEAVVRIMERFGDMDKPIWITETGYGTQSTTFKPLDAGLENLSYVSEADQAEGVRVVYETAAAYAQVERVFWWSLRDYHSNASPTNPAMEAHYGLLAANFRPKPSYYAYASLSGEVDLVHTLHAIPGGDGIARATVPASFINKSGVYIIFAGLIDNKGAAGATPPLTSVFFYQAVSP